MKFNRQELSDRVARFARHPRTRKTAIWCVSVIAAFGLLGGVIAPPILRSVLSNKLSQQLHREVTIEKVRINPYAMTATIHGFLVKERDGSTAAVSFDELQVNLEMESLFRLGPVLKRIQLVKPYINLVRDENGAYNFQDLIDEFTAGPPKESGGPPPRFSLNNIELIDGKIAFDDRPENTKHEVSSIRIGVPFISSIPSFAEVKVQPAFYAVVNGAPVQIGGETWPFKESRESAFRFDIKNFQVARYLEYAPFKLNFTVPSGSIDGHVTVAFKIAKGNPALAVSGELALNELAVQEKNQAALLKLASLDVGLDGVEVFAGKARIKAIKASGLELHLSRTRDGALNVASLVESAPRTTSPAPAKEAKPFGYRIDEIRIEPATLHFADESFERPYKTRLDNLKLAIEGLTNEPGQKAAVELSFQTEAKETFNHAGSLQLAPALVAEGKLDLSGLRLSALRPYYERQLAAEFREGLFDLSTRYSFEAKPDQPAITLSEVNAAIRELRLELSGQPEPLWRIASLAVKDGAIDVGQKTITIGVVESRDGNGYVQRDRDGKLSYARLVKADSSKQPEPTPAPQGDAGWKIAAKRIVLDRFRINYDDRTSASPLKLNLSELSLRADDFSNARNHRTKATLRTRINNKGALTLSGTASANPVVANFTVEGQDVELVPFQPTFIDQFNFSLTGGRAATKGKLVYDGGGSGPAKLAYEGSVQVQDFATVEKGGTDELLKWQSLNLDGVQFSLPMHLRINEITLADFYSRLVLGADGKMNLQKLTVEKTEQAGAGEAKPDKPEEPAADPASGEKRVSIGKINLQRGHVYFSDFFIKPNYSANLTSFDGVISELKPDTPGDIAIQAKLDNYAPVEIRGKINPLAKDLYLDIAADAKEIEMSPFSPYSIKYVGYGIEKGKLSLNVKYKLENRKLEAQNQIILNQLTFGDRVESPTATKLPVLLAVALLKDRNGVIDVNLPVTGSLDDPQFSVGGIVLRLVMNIITRAVTAPFTLIAGLFGGGGSGEELSYVEFEYGSAALTAAAEAKIKTLANAMNNRPALKLEINPRIDPVNDMEGLRKASLERKVKAQKLKELAGQGPTPPSVDEVQVAANEYERYLKAAYGAESFPKPRNVIGLAKELPVSEMEALMLKHIQLSDEDLRDLAQRRAEIVRNRLFSAAQIGSDRVFVVAPKTAPDDGKAKGSRVDFSLR